MLTNIKEVALVTLLSLLFIFTHANKDENENANLVRLAKVAATARRSEDVTEYLKRAALIDKELTSDEQKALSNAYKRILDFRRQAWVVVHDRENQQGISEKQKKIYSTLRLKIEREQRDICNDVIKLMKALEKKPRNARHKEYFENMKKEYTNYLAEVQPGADQPSSGIMGMLKALMRKLYSILSIFNGPENQLSRLRPNTIELVELAKVARDAIRPDDMAGYMRKAAEISKGMSPEDQELLTMAFKAVVDMRRKALVAIGHEEEEISTSYKKELTEFKRKVEKEQIAICNDVVKLMNTMIKKSKKPEDKIFYYIMKGDYYRYLGEVKTGKESKAAAENSRKAYQAAYEISEQHQKPTDDVRIEIALKLSILYGEHLGSFEKAIEISKQAIEAAESAGTGMNSTAKARLELLKSNLHAFEEAANEGAPQT